MPNRTFPWRPTIRECALVTGPTGSGKSTTLYASLMELDTIVASSLLAVLAQRLVRTICPHCKLACEPTSTAHELLRDFASGHEPYAIFHGNGCGQCRGTGYRGRLGVFELLTIDDQVQSLITQRASATEIRTIALNNEMVPMRTDGLGKVLSGKTTIEEIVRVTVEVD